MAFPFLAAGGALSSIAGLFKKSPRAIPVDPTDPASVARDTVSSNLANFGPASELSFADADSRTDQAISLAEKRVPGYARMREKLMAQAEEAATNPYDVPVEVEENLARLAAERGISTGGRGQFSDFSLLRDLGVNQLQYGESRINQAQGILATLNQLLPQISPVSPLAFLPTYGQALETSFRNAENKQAVLQGGENARTEADNDRLGALGSAFGSFASLLDNMEIGQTRNSTTSMTPASESGRGRMGGGGGRRPRY